MNAEAGKKKILIGCLYPRGNKESKWKAMAKKSFFHVFVFDLDHSEGRWIDVNGSLHLGHPK